jgi:hypothetical protein
VKTTPAAGKVTVRVFWNSQGVLFIDFLIEQTINAVYYSKLLTDRVKSDFVQNDELGQTKASVSSTTKRVRTPLL